MADDTVDVRLRLRDHRRFNADARSAARAVDDIGDAGGRTSRSFDRGARSSGRMRRGLVLLRTAALAGGVALGGALFYGAKESVAAFEESRQVVAQTGAVLRSTGHAANVTAADVDRLTASLMAKTAIDDEQIRTGANVLLTFTKVRDEVGRGNKVFSRATALAVDMAAAMGTDARSAAMTLGKALNDPAKGATALRKAGVDAAVLDQAKAMAESGDLLGAQRRLLRELAVEFGGSARAQATPLKRLNIAYGELQETVGGMLAPAVDDGARALAGFLNEMQAGKGAGGEFVATLQRIWGEVEPVAAGFADAAKDVGDFVGEHPEIVKVGVALVGVATAARMIRFVGAITGINRLIRLTGALGRTRAGQRATSAIVGEISKLPGLAKRPLERSRNVFRNMMGSVGRTGGNAAADGIVTNTSSRVSTAAGPGGRLRSATRVAFRGLGAAGAMAFVAEYGDDVIAGIDDLLSQLPGSRTSGVEGGARHGAGSTPIPGMPGVNLDQLGEIGDRLGLGWLGGGRRGGVVRGSGIQSFGRGGLVLPPGEHGLAALRIGEYVMQDRAVDHYGLATMRALNNRQIPVDRLDHAGGNAEAAALAQAANRLARAVEKLDAVPEGALLRKMGQLVEDEAARR